MNTAITKLLGIQYPEDLDAGTCRAGQVQGLIHDIPTARELITRIVQEATSLIETRLRAVLA